MDRLIFKENYCDFYLGNHIDILKIIPDESVDCILSSPPYGKMRDYKGYKYDITLLVPELYHVLKKGGRVIWIVKDQVTNFDLSGQSFNEWFEFKKVGFLANPFTIYGKKTLTQAWNITSKGYPQTFEFIFIFSKDKPIIFNPLIDKQNYIKERNYKTIWSREIDGSIKISNRNFVTKEFGVRTGIWYYKTGGSQTDNDFTKVHEHPAPFPLQLAVDLIQSYSNPSDTILDPMGGSGTVAKASLLLQRNSIYIDCSEEYYKLAQERFLHSKEKLKFKNMQKKLLDFA